MEGIEVVPLENESRNESPGEVQRHPGDGKAEVPFGVAARHLRLLIGIYTR